MYVDPGARRHGIARQMLRFAEDECRRRKIFRLELSTSELQDAAVALWERRVSYSSPGLGPDKQQQDGRCGASQILFRKTFVTISFRSVRWFEGKMRRFAASGLQACFLGFRRVY
jgi:GNAT superfamily N-acetyltransferase